MSMHFASMRIGRHPTRWAVAMHAHDTRSLCILTDGAYEGNIRGRRDERIPGSLSLCPAHEAHSQRIGRAGATKLILTPTRGGLDFLSTHERLEDTPAIRCESGLANGRRMIAELSVNDEFSAVAVEGLSHELLAVFDRAITSHGDLPARWLRDARDYLAGRAPQSRPLSYRRLSAKFCTAT